MIVTVDVHFSERFPEPSVAIHGDRQADEATSMDHLITDLRPTEDTSAAAQMGVIERDQNQYISVDVRSEQPDQIVAEIVQPVSSLLILSMITSVWVL